MKDHRKGIVNREIRDAAQHELKHWKQRNAVKKKAARVTEKGRADKKDTVAERMEQAYELRRYDHRRPDDGQDGSEKATLRYHLKKNKAGNELSCLVLI